MQGSGNLWWGTNGLIICPIKYVSFPHKCVWPVHIIVAKQPHKCEQKNSTLMCTFHSSTKVWTNCGLNMSTNTWKKVHINLDINYQQSTISPHLVETFADEWKVHINMDSMWTFCPHYFFRVYILQDWYETHILRDVIRSAKKAIRVCFVII